MNITLWVVAGLLAAIFLMSGLAKLAQSKEKLVASPTGAALAGYSPGAIKGIGTAEVLGAVGLVLPAVVDIAPVLVPLAGVGLVALMVGAIATHLRRDEAKVIAMPLVLLVLSALVAWGRFGPYSFTG
ncbi:DoxX family protein [Actinophytocola sp. NPDC049390]|uniref:DoxX family protein n=1 Tax=Actinophytocola sp. NPDC049390 TaxID=3363894 RepID=UPI003788C0A3